MKNAFMMEKKRMILMPHFECFHNQVNKSKKKNMYQNLRLFIYWTLHMCNGVQIKKLDSEMELEIEK